MNTAIFSRIKSRIDALDLTEAAVCREAGVGRDAIRDIRRRPHILPRIDTLAALAGPLKTTPEWLAFGRGEELSAGDQVLEVPLVSWDTAAGFVEAPISHAANVGNSLHLSDLPHGRYIALTIDGDSMNEVAAEGSIIVVKIDTNELCDRKYYIINIDGSTLFRRFRSEPARLEPASFNPKHETIFLKENATPIGRVVLALNYI
ncbi:S24 family peptidase [Azorhizobium sp. AG788]|uniref:S24 family peptidase n=1 Tax=Azorhizobium sp. AG788 TaxID=2183897 RepID=UPI003138A96B